MHRYHPARRSLTRANGCTTIGRRRDFHAGVIACGEMQAPRQTVELFKPLRLPRRSPMEGMKRLNFASIKRILDSTALACAFACAESAGLAETGAIMIAI